MKPAAQEGFIALTTNLEGYTPFMYLDIKGYVTTGIGNLIENLSTHTPGGAYSPFKMKWRRKSDNEYATHEEIQAEWDQIKARQEHKLKGGFFYKQFATLYLDDEAIAEIVDNVAKQFEGTLRSRFANWDSFPADAQVATMLVAWAYGPGFGSGQGLGVLVHALNNSAFATAASVFPKSALTVDRNAAVKLLYQNADVVVVNRLDTDLLYYPKDLVRGDDPTGGGGPIPKRGSPGKGDSGPNDAVQRNLAAQLALVKKEESKEEMSTATKVVIGVFIALGIGYIAYRSNPKIREELDTLIDKAKKAVE